ncbi:helix-turn-helix domain-containing protein [Streptomyces inhibens]|uniref:helix-turn-helix domain-containing protein n=1 Tax=Streptomyces inhibens TaxID=2293571 RepID=UPI00402A680F
MRSTGDTDGLCPRAAGDAAALVELMQRLKNAAGLTYRQLEQRAAERGEVLARSTLADVLRRHTLPRDEVLTAFVRACGRPEDEVGEWRAARQRIAAREAAGEATDAAERTSPADARPATGDAPDVPVPDPPHHRPHRKRGALMIAAAALAALLLAVGVRLLVGDGGARPEAAAAATLPTGEVRIRPLRAPDLCLTDGRVQRAHAYHTVAVQRPCTEAVPPHTHLTVAGAGLHRIQWTHPDKGGKGCLVLLREPGVAGLLEPWDDCTAGGPAQVFRIEAVGGRTGSGGTAYRLRLSDGDRCLALGGGGSGVTALARPCTGGDDQKFLIGPV